MDQLDYTTTDETNHRKGKHLTLDERGIIAYLHNQGKSYQVIADAIGCAKSTVFYEIRRGTQIDNYSAEDILFAADCINLLPRKTLNYDTPESLFNNELDLIYAM